MSAIPIIVGYALREALRRKVFTVVLLLTAGAPPSVVEAVAVTTIR